MDNQNLILLAIGVFLTLIITATAVDRFLLDEHPPLEVDGLIWRVENAFAHIHDLETVLEVTEVSSPMRSMRLLVRYLSGPPSAMSVRYLSPADIEGELFTVEGDLLSHYFPQENLVVVKRWVGVPLAAIGLAGFDLQQLRSDWASGQVRAQVLQSVAGFTNDLISSPIVTSTAFASCATQTEHLGDTIEDAIRAGQSFGRVSSDEAAGLGVAGFSHVEPIGTTGSIQGSYILEVRDALSGALERMIWVKRDTFLVHKVVAYREGVRQKTIQVEWILLDQGFTEDELLTLPRDAELIRG